jgi:hypothetical protein
VIDAADYVVWRNGLGTSCANEKSRALLGDAQP